MQLTNIKQVYNQQIAHIENTAIVFRHLQGVSILKDVYSVVIQLCQCR
jgi:hypothetical protein